MANATFRGAIKAIGCKIPLVFDKTTVVTATTTYEYDFVLDGDYLLTGLSAIKKNASMPASGTLVISVKKVSGPSDGETVDTLASVTFVANDANNLKVSSTSIDAGVVLANNATDDSQQKIRISIVATKDTHNINPSAIIEAIFVRVDEVNGVTLA